MTLTQWFQKPNIIKLICVGAFMVILNACGSSSSSSDPDSSMEVKLKVDPLTRLVTGEATLSGFTATAVHIHQGAVGADGPVLIGLVQDSVNANLFVTPDGARFTEDQYDDYIAGSTYFNSHSAEKPEGVVREQIAAQTIDISNLSINETTGDASGYVEVTGFTPTVAHIHTGFAGESGGVAVTLEADGTIPGQFNAPSTGNQVTLTDYAAGKLYVNVHSADFPSGHIREQIVPTDIQVIAVAADGSQSVPAVTTEGTATAYITVNESTGALDAVLDLHNIDDSTMAHIHDGLAGATGGIIQGFDGTAGDTTWTITGAMLTTGTGENLEKLLTGAAYVNVHTDTVGSGEARGQILPDGVLLAIAPLTAEEAAGTNSSGTSTGSGTGYVTVNKNETPDATVKANLIFSETTATFEPTVAHIHTDNSVGAIGAGGVVEGFTLDTVAGTGTIDANFSAAEVSEFEADGFYINLHTADNPDGELRGQLTP